MDPQWRPTLSLTLREWHRDAELFARHSVATRTDHCCVLVSGATGGNHVHVRAPAPKSSIKMVSSVADKTPRRLGASASQHGGARRTCSGLGRWAAMGTRHRHGLAWGGALPRLLKTCAVPSPGSNQVKSSAWSHPRGRNRHLHACHSCHVSPCCHVPSYCSVGKAPPVG